MPAALRDAPAEAIELIKSFEGIPDGDPSTVNLDAYLCPADIWTIGWGHALDDGGQHLKGAQNKARARALYPGGITLEQAQLLLRADLVPRAASVCSMVKVPIDDGQFGALLAFVFNVGAANLGASTLLRRLNAGDFAGAADQFMVWDKARVKGVLQPLAGLTRRRRAERALFLGADWRAASALPARRGRAAALEVLPVPAAPADQQALVAEAAQRKAARPSTQAAKAKQAPKPKKAAPKSALTAAAGKTAKVKKAKVA